MSLPQVQDATDDDETTAGSVNKSDTISVNYITFNQNASCVAVGLNSGYRIYSCKPTFSKCFHVKKNESIGIIEMLYSTSLIAVVGLGDEPGTLPRKLKVLNTKLQTTICDLIFPSSILLVKLSSKRMIILLEEQIYIYDIMTMNLLHTIETSPNVNRLCTLSGDISEELSLLAYPSPPKTITHDSLLVNGINTNGGSNSAQNNIQSVSNAPNRVGDAIIFDLITLQPLAVIEAHKSALAAMCLSSDGSLLATASDKGTIVRVFNVQTGVKLFQYRRGSYPTKIYSLSFSKDNRYVVATSSSETVHIFRLGETELLANKQKQKMESKLKNLKITPGHEIIEEECEDPARQDMNYEDEEDLIEDDGDDSDAEDGDDASLEVPNKQRKLSQSSSNSYNSVVSGMSGISGTDDQREKSDPLVDQNRLSVARIIRRSSQTLGRKAAQKMGDFLPSRFSSILEPTRHFASLKIQTAKKEVKSIAILDSEVHVDTVPRNYLLLRENSQEIAPRTDMNFSGSSKDLIQLNLIHINVVTSEGFYYTYGLDPERGGDCILLHQYSLLDD